MKNLIYIPGWGHCQLKETIKSIPVKAHYCGTAEGEDESSEYSIYEKDNTFYCLAE